MAYRVSARAIGAEVRVEGRVREFGAECLVPDLIVD